MIGSRSYITIIFIAIVVHILDNTELYRNTIIPEIVLGFLIVWFGVVIYLAIRDMTKLDEETKELIEGWRQEDLKQ